MDINIIGVPIYYGADKRGGEYGPEKLRQKELLKILSKNSHQVYDLGNLYVPEVKDYDKFYSHSNLKYLEPIVEVNKNLAHSVYSSLRAESFPLVIGGDHSIALGSISGVSRAYKNFAVIWMDAHGDINTHETSRSGNIHGMPLAKAMNVGYKDLTNIYFEGQKVNPENVFILGARDLDPGEIELIKEMKLNVYSADEINGKGIDTVINQVRVSQHFMKEKFLIGELSKIFNISTDTLRYYDKIGLLKPDYDEVNRYRYYSIEKFFILSRILFLKNLDISLEDIKSYFNNQNTDHLLMLLKNEETEIDIEIHRLMNLKRKITNKINLIEGADQYINEIRIERLSERWGVFIDIENIEDNYEIKNSFKKHEAHFKISSWLNEGQIYTSISKEDILGQRFQRFNYFIEILSRGENVNTQVRVLPENDHACIVYCGSYNKIDHYYKMLIQWIDENGYEIAGDSIEKNIVDYGFSDSEEEYISEIQIPVVLKES